MEQHTILDTDREQDDRKPALKEALSIDDAADEGDSCRTRIYEEIRAGRLIARKNGKRTIILRADFVRWLNALPDRKSNV